MGVWGCGVCVGECEGCVCGRMWGGCVGEDVVSVWGSVRGVCVGGCGVGVWGCGVCGGECEGCVCGRMWGGCVGEDVVSVWGSVRGVCVGGCGVGVMERELGIRLILSTRTLLFLPLPPLSCSFPLPPLLSLLFISTPATHSSPSTHW